MLPAPLAIICGLKSEADCWRRVLPAQNIYISAARPYITRQITQAAIAHGAKLLISFGLAGGLDSALPPGQLLLPTHIFSDHGAWEVDQEYHKKIYSSIHSNLGGNFPNVITAPLYGSDRLLITKRHKADARARLGATASPPLSVDMESHIVAEAAHAAGVPFLVLRALADTAEMDLPEIAQKPLNDDGTPQLANIVRELIRQPRLIPETIHMGRMAHLAHASLKRVVAVLVR